MFAVSLKNVDRKNRLRSKTVAFRVSPEEWNSIETAVALSVLTKQDYIVSRLENRKITVQGNPRVYKALRNELAKVQSQLTTLPYPTDELLETINLIATTLNGLKEESNVPNP